MSYDPRETEDALTRAKRSLWQVMEADGHDGRVMDDVLYGWDLRMPVVYTLMRALQKATDQIGILEATVAQGQAELAKVDGAWMTTVKEVNKDRHEWRDEAMRLRSVMERLDEWEAQLRAPGPEGTSGAGVGPFIAQELRNRINGVKP